jgi:twitching motility protein PilT
MIDFINRASNAHIMTIEDPIEFVHRNKGSLINQREVGADTHSFANSLRTVLRQDPDVIMIGEMRDADTIGAALTIAETGHLTFATLHTSDVVQTINRVIDVFPSHQQQQVRTQLSFTLEAVYCQQLLPRADGRGRVMACEILVCNQAIRSLIREDKIHQVHSIIQTGGRHGMRTMNQALFELYRHHQVTLEEALAHTSDPDDLRRLFQRQA